MSCFSAPLARLGNLYFQKGVVAFDATSGSKGRVSRDKFDEPYPRYWHRCLICRRRSKVIPITNAHILPANVDTTDWSLFTDVYGRRAGFRDDVNPRSHRNYLPLCGTKGDIGTCHNYFDSFSFALLYNPFERVLFTRVPPLLLLQTPALAEVDNLKIRLPPEEYMPYTRLLAARAVAVALRGFDEELLERLQAPVCFSRASSASSQESEKSSSSGDEVGSKRSAADGPAREQPAKLRKCEGTEDSWERGCDLFTRIPSHVAFRAPGQSSY